MIQAGICGFGGMGHVHAASLAGMPDVAVAAVCDIRPSQLEPRDVSLNVAADTRGFDIRSCRTFTDFREMLAHQALDVVVIALPTDLHAEYSIRALDAGCHVFCEKPMALSVAECDRMLAAQRRSGKQLMIAQCLRFWPAYEALLAAIREGTYGRLQSLAMDRIGGYARWGMDSWFNDARRSGGAILDLHLHDVDWALHALGAPAGLFAAGRPGHTRGIDDVTAVWDYDGGPIVTIRGSWMYAGFLMTFRALFDEGVLEFGFPPDRSLRLLTRESREATPLDISGESAYVREMRYFLDCVQGRRVNTLCTPESTRESIGMVMREHEAIAARARVAPDAGRAG